MRKREREEEDEKRDAGYNLIPTLGIGIGTHYLYADSRTIHGSTQSLHP